MESIRAGYQQEGVTNYYQQHGSTYRNPHEPILAELIPVLHSKWNLDLSSVLDLACGSGEMTLAIKALGCKLVTGVDPYTQEAYLARTGNEVISKSFEQIQAGEFLDRKFSLIVCSFALHLADTSRLPVLIYHLASIAPTMLLLSPHKRPYIQDEWGFALEQELEHQRVHARLFKSLFHTF